MLRNSSLQNSLTALADYLMWLVILPCYTQAAIQPSPSVGWASLRMWRTEQGLPHNAVERLYQSHDGWLWIGTRDGLARFDGITFTVFNGETPGFTSDTILDMTEDAEGHLWIATKRGAYRHADGKFARLASSDGLISDHVSQIYPERGGGLWFATAKGLSRMAGGTFQNFPFTTTVTNSNGGTEDVHHVHSVWVERDGGVRLGADGGLFRLSSEDGVYGQEWMESGPFTTLFPGVVRVLREDRAGRTWWATDRQLVRQTGTNLATVLLPVIASDNRVRRLVEGTTAHLWLVHSGALFRVVEAEATPSGSMPELTLERMELKPGLSDEYVTDFMEDRDGTLWVGTRFGGLYQFRQPRLQLLTTKDGLPHNTVHVVTTAREGGIWIGTAGGAGRWHRGTYEPLQIAGVTNITDCQALLEDRSGALWISGELRGFWSRPLFSGGKYTPSAPANPEDLFPPDHPYALTGTFLFEPERFGYRGYIITSGSRAVIYEDRARRIWLGNHSGLGCVLTNSILDTPAVEGNEKIAYSRKRADRWWYGDASVVMDRGVALFEFRPDGWSHDIHGRKSRFGSEVPWPDDLQQQAPIEIGVRLPNYRVRCFAEDSEGTLWFGTDGGGLQRIVGQIIETLKTTHGLAGDIVETILADPTSGLWVGTQSGLSRVVPNSTTRVPDSSPRVSVRITTLTKRHGLPDDQIRQIVPDRLGHFWIGSRA